MQGLCERTGLKREPRNTRTTRKEIKIAKDRWSKNFETAACEFRLLVSFRVVRVFRGFSPDS